MNAHRPSARPRHRIVSNRQALLALAALACAALVSPADAQRDRWRSVSVGSDHACALDAEGRAYCWGYNHAGQLGARTAMKCGIEGESGHRGCHPDASETVPLAVGGGVRFASVSAGEYLACGTDARGAAFCWGAPAAEPARYRDACMDEEPCSFTPVPLMPGRRFAVVDARARCAADAEGASFCWGDPHRGPGRVKKPWEGEEIAFVAGDPGNDGEHPTSCAVRRDGGVICRGEAAFGLRGNGPDTTATGAVDSPARFSRVAVLENWACGLDAAGAAFCWGAAGYDDVRGTDPRPRDEVCERWAVSTYCNRRPAAVEGAPPFRTLVAYGHSTMPVIHEMIGLTADGRAYAWGGDRRVRPWRPEHRWASVSANRWGECGVTTDGALFCWGANPHDTVQGRIPHP
jgi:hypothetical protein